MLRISLLCAGAGVVSWWLTAIFRRYAIRRGILDVPNVRSSHDTPTPRGGGVAIVLASLASLLGLAITRDLPTNVALGLCAGGALVAVIGFLDDRRPLKAVWRLVGHVAAAAWLLLSLGDFVFPPAVH